MELSCDARIAFPRDLVFTTYRDEIAQLVTYLPNVRSIHVRSRTDDGPIAQIVNDWQGGGEIPAALRAVVGDSMLSWTDYASWNADALRCDWRTETHAFSEALRCSGHNSFLPDGPDKTRLEVRGILEIDGRRIRGVPGFLAAKIGRGIEEFLGGKINLNLAETAHALSRYLEAKRAPA